jgi:DUF4097 and DUF4098 domain-containing protein YvlB
VTVPAGLPVSGQTTDGGIELHEVGAVDVGTVDLHGGSVQALTANGTITLSVPKGSYRVDTDTDNGRRRINVADDPNGRHTLQLRTDNGSIEVEQV